MRKLYPTIMIVALWVQAYAQQSMFVSSETSYQYWAAMKWDALPYYYPEEVIRVLPVRPATTTGSTLTILATSLTDKNISQQEWRDLKTGSSANYRLLNEKESTLIIDASVATVGSIQLEYSFTDIYGIKAAKTIEVTVYGEDHGDLPHAEEATHLVPVHPLVFLGNTIDTELNDQPSLTAGESSNSSGGDDRDLTDDEDGIFMPLAIVRGQETAFYAEAINNSGKVAHLTAFVDWNKDGQYNGPYEMASVTVAPDPVGLIRIPFWVPEDAKVNTRIYARFRISTDGPAVMQFSGPAMDGEVEDYVVRVDR